MEEDEERRKKGVKRMRRKGRGEWENKKGEYIRDGERGRGKGRGKETRRRREQEEKGEEVKEEKKGEKRG